MKPSNLNEINVKLNSKGQPMLRNSKSQFVKGNTEGKRIGVDIPVGRPKGVKNTMTIIKEIALQKCSNDGKTNIGWATETLVKSSRHLQKIIDNTEDESPKLPQLLTKQSEICSRILENLSKYSGDYAQKIQAQITEELTDDEKRIMDDLIKNKVI